MAPPYGTNFPFGASRTQPVAQGAGFGTAVANARGYGAAPVFAAWDPTSHGADITLSNNNLTATRGAAAAAWRAVSSTISVDTGKWYWEIRIDAATSGGGNVGNGLTDGIGAGPLGPGQFVGETATSAGYQDSNVSPLLWQGGVALISPCNFQVQNGATFRFALDADNQRLWIGRDFGFCTDPTSGVGEQWSGFGGPQFAAVSMFDPNYQVTANFGATPFAFLVPAGFNAGLYR